MKAYSKLAVLGTSLATLACCASSFAGDDKKPAAPRADNDDVVIVDAYQWYPYPFYYEPTDWFHKAEVSYRKKEGKAAAAEIRKAESWLNYAAGHALPMTKQSLLDASATLKTLADDLDKGHVASARSLDAAVARASHALAEWHYFNATDQSLAKDEEHWAENNLKAAALHIRNAAKSSSYEYGDNFVSVYDDFFGWEDVTISPNKQAANLTAIKAELDKLGESLKNGGDAK